MIIEAKGIITLNENLNAEFNEKGELLVYGYEISEYTPNFIADAYGNSKKNDKGLTETRTRNWTIKLKPGERLEVLKRLFEVRDGLLFDKVKKAFVDQLKVSGIHYKTFDNITKIGTSFIVINQKWNKFSPETFLRIKEITQPVQQEQPVLKESDLERTIKKTKTEVKIDWD